VLVDTTGFNPKNEKRIDDIKACLDHIGGIEIHLALSATAKESNLLNAINCVNPLGVQHLIFTKLDESCTYGNLINVLFEHPLPVSYVTNGREVPNAIQTGSMDKIIEHLLGGFKNRKTDLATERSGQSSYEAPARIEGRTFVANKNSDVFHRPECKWTQKIKPKNMITFSSVQTAKEQHFLPCRDCRPSASRHFHNGLPASGKMQMTN
jgi:flagellar biosynthesis protein FlhF